MFKDYKGTRKPMPDELREQVPIMKEVLKAMEIPIMEQAGLEADDILGTLAKKAEKDGIEVSLVSGDRDLLQIASSRIKIRIPKTKMGRTEIEDYYEENVLEKYQVTPTQFIDVKALMGDTADNIPGVPKVGEKTATGLIVEYGSLDGIYANIEGITKKSIKESLIENKELAYLSKTLATIKTDCEINLDYEKDPLKRILYEIFFDAREIITKDLNTILVLEDTNIKSEQCIKCGKCSEVCPVGLMPVMIIDNKERANKLRIEKCIECGLCSYVCPAKIEVREILRKIKEQQ